MHNLIYRYAKFDSIGYEWLSDMIAFFWEFSNIIAFLKRYIFTKLSQFVCIVTDRYNYRGQQYRDEKIIFLFIHGYVSLVF